MYKGVMEILYEAAFNNALIGRLMTILNYKIIEPMVLRWHDSMNHAYRL